MENNRFQAVLEQLKHLTTTDRPVYLVGGAVRDLLLKRPGHDLDLAVPGPTRALAKAAADRLGGALYVLDEARDTTRVVVNGGNGERLLLDFASLRGSDIEEDLRGRDFTINALAYDLADPNQLIDPTGGLADLRQKILRACSATSLQDDPARVLRVVRLALSLGYRIAPDTLKLVRAATPMLARVSPERQRDELFKMLDGPQVSRGIEILDQLGALSAVLPELEKLKGVSQSAPHISNVWEHTLNTVRYLEDVFASLVGAFRIEAADVMTGLATMRLGRYRDHLERHYSTSANVDRSQRSLLFMAALYHDIAKPFTRSQEAGGKVRFLGHPEKGSEIAAERARALMLSNVEVQRVETIVEHHMRCHFLASSLKSEEDVPSRRAIYRFFKDTGPAGVDICLLSLADVRGTYGVTLPQETWLMELNVCRALLEAYWEQSEAVVSPPRFLTGDDLMETFGLKPGPAVGALLDAIREGQAAGELNSREEALDFARRWLDQPQGIG